jgi:hypothetical protein
MNRIGRNLGTLAAFLVALAAGGCGDREEAAAAQDGEPAVADGNVTDSVFAPAAEREALPSSRIYYTLTQHEWYARGQPLVHDSRAYHPAGMPVSASVSEMSPAGDYHGVEYYVRQADADATLYIPVFEGYWQAFRADTSAAGVN